MITTVVAAAAVGLAVLDWVLTRNWNRKLFLHGPTGLRWRVQDVAWARVQRMLRAVSRSSERRRRRFGGLCGPAAFRRDDRTEAYFFRLAPIPFLRCCASWKADEAELSATARVCLWPWLIAAAGALAPAEGVLAFPSRVIVGLVLALVLVVPGGAVQAVLFMKLVNSLAVAPSRSDIPPEREPSIRG